jgi:hypothetical protein
VIPEHEGRRLKRQFDLQFQKGEEDEGVIYFSLSGLRDHLRHKSYWSFFLMFLMFAMVAFQSVLIGLVGAGIWNFSQYRWLLPTLMIQYLVQIVSLAVFVVRSLFKDGARQPPPHRRPKRRRRPRGFGAGKSRTSSA